MKYVFITPVDVVVVFSMVIFFRVIHVPFSGCRNAPGKSTGDFEPELLPKTDRRDVCGTDER